MRPDLGGVPLIIHGYDAQTSVVISTLLYYLIT